MVPGGFKRFLQMARKPNEFKIIKGQSSLGETMNRTVSASHWFFMVFFKL